MPTGSWIQLGMMKTRPQANTILSMTIAAEIVSSKPWNFLTQQNNKCYVTEFQFCFLWWCIHHYIETSGRKFHNISWLQQRPLMSITYLRMRQYLCPTVPLVPMYVPHFPPHDMIMKWDTVTADVNLFHKNLSILLMRTTRQVLRLTLESVVHLGWWVVTNSKVEYSITRQKEVNWEDNNDCLMKHISPCSRLLEN